MSRILDELKDAVLSCSMEEKLPHRWVDNHEMVGGAIDMIDSLGENARRLLEIGIVQDRLVDLGLNIRTFGTLAIGERILVVFTNHAAILLDHSFEYTSTTWQDDLINRVKELINE